MIFKHILPLFFFITMFPSCNINKAEQYFNKAELLEEEGNLQEAIEMLDKAIVEDENYIAAYINRGSDKSLLGNYTDAITDYSIAIKIDSTNILAYLNRGKNKKRLSDDIGAINDFNKGLALKGYKDGLLTITFVGNPFFNIDDGQTSIEPTISEILYERGIAYFYTDSLQQALSDFNYCISKGNIPKTNREFEFEEVNDCYYWRGLVYLKSGYKEKGCEDLNIADNMGVPEAKEEIEKYCK